MWSSTSDNATLTFLPFDASHIVEIAETTFQQSISHWRVRHHLEFRSGNQLFSVFGVAQQNLLLLWNLFPVFQRAQELKTTVS